MQSLPLSSAAEQALLLEFSEKSGTEVWERSVLTLGSQVSSGIQREAKKNNLYTVFLFAKIVFVLR